MLTPYVVCLVTGLAILIFQLVAGHDAGGGHDVDHASGDHDAAPWLVIASLRFWSFALLAFGLAGAMLHLFGLAGAVATLVIAGISGLASGLVAVTVIRRLTAKGPTSNVSRGEVVGRLGRVIVPLGGGVPGKVRVQLRGTWIDLVARSHEPIDAGEAVIVEEAAGAEVLVSKAPTELKA